MRHLLLSAAIAMTGFGSVAMYSIGEIFPAVCLGVSSLSLSVSLLCFTRLR
jgi:hypothetical protein